MIKHSLIKRNGRAEIVRLLIEFSNKLVRQTHCEVVQTGYEIVYQFNEVGSDSTFKAKPSLLSRV